MMKQAEIDAIKARCAAASPGPWTLEDPWKTCGGANLVRTGPGVLDFFQCSTTADNRFCAHAPTDISRLLEYVKRLRRVLALSAETMRGVGIQDDEWVKPRYQQILEALGEEDG